MVAGKTYTAAGDVFDRVGAKTALVMMESFSVPPSGPWKMISGLWF